MGGKRAAVCPSSAALIATGLLFACSQYSRNTSMLAMATLAGGSDVVLFQREDHRSEWCGPECRVGKFNKEVIVAALLKPHQPSPSFKTMAESPGDMSSLTFYSTRVSARGTHWWALVFQDNPRQENDPEHVYEHAIVMRDDAAPRDLGIQSCGGSIVANEDGSAELALVMPDGRVSLMTLSRDGVPGQAWPIPQAHEVGCGAEIAFAARDGQVAVAMPMPVPLPAQPDPNQYYPTPIALYVGKPDGTGEVQSFVSDQLYGPIAVQLESPISARVLVSTLDGFRLWDGKRMGPLGSDTHQSGSVAATFDGAGKAAVVVCSMEEVVLFRETDNLAFVKTPLATLADHRTVECAISSDGNALHVIWTTEEPGNQDNIVFARRTIEADRIVEELPVMVTPGRLD